MEKHTKTVLESTPLLNWENINFMHIEVELGDTACVLRVGRHTEIDASEWMSRRMGHCNEREREERENQQGLKICNSN